MWPFSFSKEGDNTVWVHFYGKVILIDIIVYLLTRENAVVQLGPATFYANCSGYSKRFSVYCTMLKKWHRYWKRCSQETFPYAIARRLLNFAWHFGRSWKGTFYFPFLYWLPSQKLCLVAMETNIDLKQMKLVSVFQLLHDFYWQFEEWKKYLSHFMF